MPAAWAWPQHAALSCIFVERLKISLLSIWHACNKTCPTPHVLTRALLSITLQSIVNSWNKAPKKYIASRAHGVLTNVPGPQVPIMYVMAHVLGAREIWFC